MTGAAVSDLVKVLVQKTDQVFEEPGDPLLSACRIVGQDQGIDIRPQPAGQMGYDLDDPLKAIAKASKIRTRLVLLEGTWWKEDHGALLGFMEEDDRPIALLQPKPGNIICTTRQISSKKRSTHLLRIASRSRLKPFTDPFRQVVERLGRDEVLCKGIVQRYSESAGTGDLRRNPRGGHAHSHWNTL